MKKYTMKEMAEKIVSDPEFKKIKIIGQMPKSHPEDTKPITKETFFKWYEDAKHIYEHFNWNVSDHYQLHKDSQGNEVVGLHSPFLVSPLVAIHYNRHLWSHKIKTFDELLNKKTWDISETEEAVYAVERPYRVIMLYQAKQLGHYDPKQMDEDEWWDLLIGVWTDCEGIFQSPFGLNLFIKMFGWVERSLKNYKELPEGEFTIYRGGTSTGHSWSLSREVGEFFSNRFGELSTGKIHQKTITKDDVLFYTNNREEQEVVLKTIFEDEVWETEEELYERI
jgi:hypothetical protein